MNVAEMEKVLKQKFPDAPFHTDETGNAGVIWSVSIPIAGIREAAAEFDKAGYFLETITALDFEDTFELVYHFNRFEPRS
ncbi:MAG: hypothetical protein AAGU11_08240, partial [Syntrophobacteraceae bacterium]